MIGGGLAAGVLAIAAMVGGLAQSGSPPVQSSRARGEAAAFSAVQGPLPLQRALASCPTAQGRGAGARTNGGTNGAANVGMRVKLQKDRQATFGFQRWWDPEWRSLQTANVKDPEKQFDVQTLEMAKLMGVTPEELAKTMSNTAKAQLDTSEYDNLLAVCIKAAKAGDLSGMVQAREVLEKMDQVGIKPNVTAYNGVIAACARAAGGRFRPCNINDTDTRADLLDRAAAMINYAGGRMDTLEFSKKWREKYPNESLALWTHPAPNSTVPLSEILRASPRFTVQRGQKFSKVLYIVTFYGNYTRALTFENLCQGKKQTPLTSSSLSAWIKRLRRRRAGLGHARSPTRGCRRQQILKSAQYSDFIL
jgi:hypothetical protein